MSGSHEKAAGGEPWERARGVVRVEWVYLLARCGTAYGLLEEETASYVLGLRSDLYRLGDYVEEYVEVSGPVDWEGTEIPVMDVRRLQVLRQRWMR